MDNLFAITKMIGRDGRKIFFQFLRDEEKNYENVRENEKKGKMG